MRNLNPCAMLWRELVDEFAGAFDRVKADEAFNPSGLVAPCIAMVANQMIHHHKIAYGHASQARQYNALEEWRVSNEPALPYQYEHYWVHMIVSDMHEELMGTFGETAITKAFQYLVHYGYLVSRPVVERKMYKGKQYHMTVKLLEVVLKSKDVMVIDLRKITGLNIDASAEDLKRYSGKEEKEEDPYNPQGDGVAQEEFSLSIPSQATPKELANFAEFYQAYPNKKGKPNAERAYYKAFKVTHHRDIMAGLARAKGSTEWAESNGKYIPHPATWLNAAGWNDDYRPFTPGIQFINNGTPPAPKPPPQRQYVAPEGSPEWYLDYVTAGMIPAHRQKFGWHKDENGEWDEARWRREHE